MKKFKIPVTWEVYGTINIEANSLEEAIKQFDEIERNGEGHNLPLENYYIDGSFNREEDEEHIKEYNGEYFESENNIIGG